MESLILTPAEAGEHININPRTLANWRSNAGGGPRYVKLGRKVGYRVSDLEEYVESQVVEPKPRTR